MAYSAWAFLLALWGLMVVLSVAYGHDAFRCEGRSYTNLYGTDCCNEGRDCGKVVDQEAAWEAQLGSVINIEINGVVKPIIVNKIYPSCDDQGYAWGCTTGCLFKATGL